jgi:hypothetical protein
MNGVSPAAIGDGHSTDGGAYACGSSVNHTGYACSAKNLVSSWRQQWSTEKGTTDPMFPFGIVSLADGTSEGNTANMPNFRHAQTAGYGFLPGPPGSGIWSAPSSHTVLTMHYALYTILTRYRAHLHRTLYY